MGKQAQVCSPCSFPICQVSWNWGHSCGTVALVRQRFVSSSTWVGYRVSPQMDSLDVGSLNVAFHFSHPQNFKLSANIYNSLFEAYWPLYWFTKVKALLADCHNWPDSRWRTCVSFLQPMAMCRWDDCRRLGKVHQVCTAKLESLRPTQVSWVLWFNSPPMLWRLKCSEFSSFTHFGQAFGALGVRNWVSLLLKFIDFIGRRNCIFVLVWSFTLGCSLLVFLFILKKRLLYCFQRLEE